MEARTEGSERALYSKFVGRPCFFSVSNDYIVAGDAGSVKVCECDVPQQHAPVRLRPSRQKEKLAGNNAVREKYLTTCTEKNLVLGTEGTK